MTTDFHPLAYLALKIFSELNEKDLSPVFPDDMHISSSYFTSVCPVNEG